MEQEGQQKFVAEKIFSSLLFVLVCYQMIHQYNIFSFLYILAPFISCTSNSFLVFKVFFTVFCQIFLWIEAQIGDDACTVI